MSAFDRYRDAFRTVAFRREDGILEMRLHRDGEASWAADEGGMNGEVGEAFLEVSRDPDNRVVILTGTGDNFIAGLDLSRPFPDIENMSFWSRIAWLSAQSMVFRNGRCKSRAARSSRAPF